MVNLIRRLWAQYILHGLRAEIDHHRHMLAILPDQIAAYEAQEAKLVTHIRRLKHIEPILNRARR